MLSSAALKSCHILQNQNVTKKIRSDVGFCCFVTFVTLFLRLIREVFNSIYDTLYALFTK